MSFPRKVIGQLEKFNSDMACRIRPCTICCSHAISACISHMENSKFESESTEQDYSLKIEKNLNFKVKFHELACITRFCVNEIRSWRNRINLNELGRLIFRKFCTVSYKNVLRQLLLSALLQQAIKVENQAGVLLNL